MTGFGRFRSQMAVLLVVLCFASVAVAQPGGGRGRRGGSGGRTFGRSSTSIPALLGIEEVLDELEVEDAQAESIRAALESYREASRRERPDFQKIRDMSDEERRSFFEEMQKKQAETTKENTELLMAFLNDKQVKRLKQIEFQMRTRGGYERMLQAEDIRKMLSVSEEQMKQIAKISEEYQEQRQELRDEMREKYRNGDGGRPDRSMIDDVLEKNKALRDSVTEKMKAVLTDAQKAKIKELQGEPFNLELPNSRQGRGGRGGNGRGGEGGGRRRGRPNGGPDGIDL